MNTVAQPGLPTQRKVLPIFIKNFISFVHHQTALVDDAFDCLNTGEDTISQFLRNMFRADSAIGCYGHVSIHQTFILRKVHYVQASSPLLSAFFHCRFGMCGNVFHFIPKKVFRPVPNIAEDVDFQWIECGWEFRDVGEIGRHLVLGEIAPRQSAAADAEENVRNAFQ